MDARIVKSKAAIQKGVLALLAEYKLSEISVSMLCKKAHINRNTFYAHYRYPAQVVDEIAQQTLREMFEICEKNHDSVQAAGMLCDYIKQHFDTCGALLSHNVEDYYLAEIVDRAALMMRDMFLSFSFSDEVQAYINCYVVSGSIAVLRHWIQTGMKDDLAAIGAEIDDAIQYFFRPKPDAKPITEPKD